MNVGFFKKHPDWPLVEEIAKVLTLAGHQAVLAGGCVRDALLWRMAHDLDMATDATPEIVEKLFPKVIPVGKSFGVCRVVQDEMQIEIATFREESDYQDGRRPDKIVYSTMAKDAERRDFTINAMFFDLKNGDLVDLVGGQADLQAGLIKTVGPATQRFSEDFLRILRAARFSAQLGFAIEDQTRFAMKVCAQGILKISSERIQEECHKAFTSAQPFLFFKEAHRAAFLNFIFLDEMWELSLDQIEEFFKTAVPHVSWAWAKLALCYLKHNKNPKEEKIATLRQYCKEMKLSGKLIAEISDIITAKSFVRAPTLAAFVELCKTGHLAVVEGFWQREKPSSVFVDFKNKYWVNGALPAAFVNGEDLIQQGFTAGPKFKALLDSAYLYQLSNPEQDKESILRFINNNQ